MDDGSLALVTAIAAVVASGVGGLFALGGVIVQERLSIRRLARERAHEKEREVALRKLQRRIDVIVDTKRATDSIYSLISTWAFTSDPEFLRVARLEVGPTRNPRADWVHVDNDGAMIMMADVTAAIFAAGRGSGDWDDHAPRLLDAYNRVIISLIRQEQRLEDGASDIPELSDAGQEAFMMWIPIVERMRMGS